MDRWPLHGPGAQLKSIISKELYSWLPALSAHRRLMSISQLGRREGVDTFQDNHLLWTEEDRVSTVLLNQFQIKSFSFRVRLVTRPESFSASQPSSGHEDSSLLGLRFHVQSSVCPNVGPSIRAPSTQSLLPLSFVFCVCLTRQMYDVDQTDVQYGHLRESVLCVCVCLCVCVSVCVCVRSCTASFVTPPLMDYLGV